MGDAPMYTEWGMPPQVSETQLLSPYVDGILLHTSLPPGRALSPNPGPVRSTLHAHPSSTTASATTAHHQPLQVMMESSSLDPSHQHHHHPSLSHGPSSMSSHLPLRVSPMGGGAGQPTPSVLYPASSVSSGNANPNEGALVSGEWAYEWHQRPPPPPPPNHHTAPSSLSQGSTTTLHHPHHRGPQLQPHPPTHRSHSSLSTRPFGLAAEERFGGDGYGHSVPLVPLPSLPAPFHPPQPPPLPQAMSTPNPTPSGSGSSTGGPSSNGLHLSPGRTLQHPLPQTYRPPTTASTHLLGRPGPPTRTLSTPIPPVAPFPPPPPPPNVHVQEHYYQPYDPSRLGLDGSAGEEEGWSAGTSNVGTGSGSAGMGGGGVEEGKRRADEGGSKPNDEQDKQARRREQNRAAQRAYKARQNKHVEEVEKRNKQLELELVERRFAMENMRDLLARIQRENDVLKTKLYPLSAAPPFEPLHVDSLEESKDPLQRILDAHRILPCPPPHLRPLPSDEDRREEARKHGVFLKEKWARFGIKKERDARELDEEEEEEEQELKGVGRISDESPIDEDNLQNLLGPRYWEVASRLVPAPPRVPFRGIWREIQSAVPDVRQDDVDVGSLCDALRRAAFCDGIEACIPQSAFGYIIETIIEPTSATNTASASSALPPSTHNNN